MNSLAEGLAENLAIDKFNTVAEDKIGQKDPYRLPIPPGLSKRDADVLKRCRRRAHQLDHNAVLCYCCPCFFGLNTAICAGNYGDADERPHSNYWTYMGE